MPASCVLYAPEAQGSLLPGRQARHVCRTRTSLGRGTYALCTHHRLQLSQESSVATRTVSVTGHAAAIHEAYRLIAQALRAEAEKARRSGGRPSDAVRLLVPNGLGLC